MKIPQHCIEKFKAKFNCYPSTTQIEITDLVKFEKFVEKSYLLWYNSKIEDKKINYTERLIEYDPTGIYIYMIKEEENKNSMIFMSSNEKRNNLEFVIKQLIK